MYAAFAARHIVWRCSGARRRRGAGGRGIYQRRPDDGSLASPYDVVTKTTNAILLMPPEHTIVNKRRIRSSVSVKRAMSACCQCRMCTDLCPRHLLGHPIEPHAFMRAVKRRPCSGRCRCAGHGVLLRVRRMRDVRLPAGAEPA